MRTKVRSGISGGGWGGGGGGMQRPPGRHNPCPSPSECVPPDVTRLLTGVDDEDAAGEAHVGSTSFQAKREDDPREPPAVETEKFALDGRGGRRRSGTPASGETSSRS